MINITGKYVNAAVITTWGVYPSGLNALQIVCANTAEVLVVPSVDQPVRKVCEDSIYIKDYGLSEGMLRSLIDNGIVRKTTKRIDSVLGPVYPCIVVNRCL